MSQFRVRYPTTKEQQGMQYATNNNIGSMKDCEFYVTVHGFEKRGLAFRAAYDAAMKSTTNAKELCAYVGSMICAISNDLRASVVEALHGVGVEPRFVEISSPGIDKAEVTEMDWPSILIYFACICIILFKKNPSYETCMSEYIHQLQKKVGFEPTIILNVPFDSSRADSIKNMLGASLALRSTLIQFIMGKMDSGRSSINSVCLYLFYVLSWSGMDELVLMNELLVVPNSNILRDPEYSREVQDLREAIAAIQAHSYPQFFIHLASSADLLKVDLSRFPKLIKIAKKIEYERDSEIARQHSHD